MTDDVKSESSFNTYDTPASLHTYLSVDERSGQAVAAINHGYDDQEIVSLEEADPEEVAPEEGMYAGNVYSLHSSETSAN